MHQKRTISAYLVKMNCKIHHRHFNSTAISDLPVAVLVIKPSHFALKKKNGYFPTAASFSHGQVDYVLISSNSIGVAVVAQSNLINVL